MVIASQAMKGAVAGLAATGFMTAAMVLGRRFLPRNQRQTLPPQEITQSMLRRTGLAPALDGQQEMATTAALHLGYGAAAGSLYAGLPQSASQNGIASGMAYGAAVWAASYLGWLPALGLPPAAPRESASRNLLLIASHLVYGAALGAILSHGVPNSPEREP
ncbi:MAG: hypothetical protein IT428_02120 [Planctomycetaceae bacterium]|nr:hypothetical protein [Planctomycetaceae bacterium]